MFSLKVFEISLILLIFNLYLVNFPSFVISTSDLFEINKGNVNFSNDNITDVITKNNNFNKIVESEEILFASCFRKNLQNLIITLINDNNKILNNNQGNTIEYDLIYLIEKVFNICSLNNSNYNNYNKLIDNLHTKIESGKYPKKCLIYLHNQNSNDTSSCFIILKQIEKDSKIKLFKTNESKNKKSYIASNKKFKKHKKNKKGKYLSPFLFIEPISHYNDSNSIKTKIKTNKTNKNSNKNITNNKNKIIQYSIITTTINKSFNKISTVPTIIHEIIPKTKYDKIKTITTNKLEIIKVFSTKTKVNLITTTVITITNVNKNTGFKPLTTSIETFSNNNNNNIEYNQIVDANYVLGDASTLVTTTMTTMTRIPYVSRFCNVLNNFGLYCSSNESSISTTTSEIITTNTIKTSTTKTVNKTSTKTVIKTTNIATTTTKTTTNTQIKTKLKLATATIKTTFTKTIITKTETDCEETIISKPIPKDNYDDSINFDPILDPDCDDNNDDDDYDYYYEFIGDDDDDINYANHILKNNHQKNRNNNINIINPNLFRKIERNKIDKNKIAKNQVFNANHIYQNKFINNKEMKSKNNITSNTISSYIPDSVFYSNLTDFIQFGNKSNYPQIAENNGFSFIQLLPILNFATLALIAIFII